MNTRVHVVVGILYNATKDKVLITKRTRKQFLAGYWEFPGGKVKKNEDPFTALKREFYEELGVNLKSAKKIIKISHDYLKKKVLLDVWEIDDWEGQPASLEDQEMTWSNKNDLFKYKFPEADKRIIKTLQLPDIYGISKKSYIDYPHLFSKLKKYFNSGLKIFQLRLHLEGNNISKENIEQLYTEAKRNNSILILNGTASDSELYAIDGIHLNVSCSVEFDRDSRSPASG